MNCDVIFYVVEVAREVLVLSGIFQFCIFAASCTTIVLEVVAKMPNLQTCQVKRGRVLVYGQLGMHRGSVCMSDRGFCIFAVGRSSW